MVPLVNIYNNKMSALNTSMKMPVTVLFDFLVGKSLYLKIFLIMERNRVAVIVNDMSEINMMLL